MSNQNNQNENEIDNVTSIKNDSSMMQNVVNPDEVRSQITICDGYYKLISSENNNADNPHNANNNAPTLQVRQGNNVIPKGGWSEEEDRLMIELVGTHGVGQWARIAQAMASKNGKQCRERWMNYLRPDIRNDAWTEEEERILIEAHREVGNKWAYISRRLPGRTENSVKNFWNSGKRKCLYRKRDGATSSGPPSPLEIYIQSLEDASASTNGDTVTAIADAAPAPAPPPPPPPRNQETIEFTFLGQRITRS